MRFTTMDAMPKTARKLSARQQELLEFMNMEVKCVKITLLPDEYSSVSSAQTTLHMSAKKSRISD